MIGVSTLRELCCVNDVLFRHVVIVRAAKRPDGGMVIITKGKS